MKKFQKKLVGETLSYRTPDWFKGKFIKKKNLKIKPISYYGAQHRG